MNNFKYIFGFFCEKPCIYTVAHPRRSLQQGQTNEPPYGALAGDLEHSKDESQSDGGLRRKSKFSCAKKLIYLLESTCPAMTTACVTTCAINTSDGKTPAIQERSSSPSLRSVMNISPKKIQMNKMFFSYYYSRNTRERQRQEENDEYDDPRRHEVGE